MSRRHLLCGGLALLAGFALSAAAQTADPYPSKPVQLVVAVPPGNPGDIIARVLAEQLSKRMNQPVRVENKPGAGGNIGANFVARAPADGYTVLLGSSGVFTTNRHLYKLSFDPLKDFTPVTLVYSAPPVLFVGAKSPFKTIQDVIDAARKEPGKYSFASYGSGHITHILGEMFKRSAGIDLIHVPYKNAPLVDVLSGQVDMMFDSPSIVLSNKEGIRPLASASAKRNPKLPDVPGMGELFPGFDMTGWLGAFVPAGTPPEVTAHLHREMAAVITGPEFRGRMDALALDAGGNTQAEFDTMVRSMAQRVGDIVQGAKIKAD